VTVRVAAVMTVFNRKEQTLACLESLRRQAGHDALLEPYVVDDGSTDGTSAAVAERFPEVTLLSGDGTLYWVHGMHLGLARAFEGDYDHYLWLNDDTQLDDDAVSVLLQASKDVAARTPNPAIIVGSTRDPASGALTYGGRERRSRLRRTRFEVLEPGDEPRPTETMNGNIVLVPREVVRRIGNIDPAYRHMWGDQDYGLRARAADCEVWTAPGTIGACSRNPLPVYGQRPYLDDLRTLFSVKGLLPSNWATFTRRWAGPLWPLFWVSPYLQRGLRVTAAHLRAARGQ
jgi:GT2 family glycosyltransferase